MSNVATINRPTERQTPIEIALQVDAQGMTTARALYSFLELRNADFSRWAKKNITNNTFAFEGTDYIRLRIGAETPTGGKFSREDYKITADFAKKLAMASKSPKGEEARDYFVQVEQNAKKFANSYQIQDELEMIAVMSREMVEQRRLSREQQVRLTAIEQTATELQETIETVKNVFVQEDDNWREMIRKNIGKIAEVTGDYQGAWAECYEELDRRGFDMKKRLKNAQARMEKLGYSKTSIKSLRRLDIIERDLKAKEIFTGIVRERVLKEVV